MLSKKEKIKEGLVGKRLMKDLETGEEYYINFDETPVFTYEEYQKYNIAQPGAKNYSDMTEEEQKIYSDIEDDNL